MKLQLKLLQMHVDQLWWFRAARLSRALLSRCSALMGGAYTLHHTVCCSHQLRRSEFKVFCLQRCPPAKWLFELLLWLKAVCPFSCDINKVLPPRKLPLSRCFLRFFGNWEKSQQVSSLWNTQTSSFDRSFNSEVWTSAGHVHSGMSAIAAIWWQMNQMKSLLKVFLHVNERLSCCVTCCCSFEVWVQIF